MAGIRSAARVVLGGLVAVGSSLTAGAQVALDHDSLGLIERQPGIYDMTPDGRLALKARGVMDREIAAMPAKGPAAVVNDYDGLETGMYYKSKDATEWTNVPSERVYA